MRWDIFCKVIDNHGDMGVCWRLAADLASRGERVRLWVDDAAALGWMAPAGIPGVEVVRWTVGSALCGSDRDVPAPFQAAVDAAIAAPEIANPNAPKSNGACAPCDVLVEAFGCDPEPAFLTHLAEVAAATGAALPVWINLEYLSAESYVERCHGLPSRVQGGPLAGATKWFFYPGFTAATGGLLREPGLARRQTAFDREAARSALGALPGQRLINLFCYEPPALGAWLRTLAEAAEPTLLLVAPGRARAAVESEVDNEIGIKRFSGNREQLSISYQPAVAQTCFDERLWAADLNCVRGEDSLVRAIWAGRALVWNIYPQDDGAHGQKLEAFLDWLQAPADLRRFHRIWNGTASGALSAMDLPAWTQCVLAARERLRQQPDLTTQLVGFALQKR